MTRTGSPAARSAVRGEEPDVRWALANERTLLAYERTALGLLVAGLAVAGTRSLTGAPLWLAALGLPLVALAAAVALEGRRRFRAAEEAIRSGQPLAPPAVATFLPWGIAVMGAAAVVAGVVELATG